MVGLLIVLLTVLILSNVALWYIITILVWKVSSMDNELTMLSTRLKDTSEEKRNEGHQIQQQEEMLDFGRP